MGHHFINHFQEADKCTLQGLEAHTMVQSSSSAMSVFQSAAHSERTSFGLEFKL